MMLFRNEKKDAVQVRLIGQTLVASFEVSEPPIVWQFDLEKNHSFTVALDRSDKGWDLGVNSAEKPFASIAHFNDFDSADQALKGVQSALMSDPSASWVDAVTRLAMPAALLILVGVLAYGFLMPHPDKSAAVDPAAVAAAMAPQPAGVEKQPKKPEMVPGQPMSADDVLKDPDN